MRLLPDTAPELNVADDPVARWKIKFCDRITGGPTIISAVLLTVINWMRLGLDAQAAINAPRFHHQWMPDRILMEQQFPASLEQG